MLLNLFGILVAILVLSILIAVHEAGHLLMAKWSNIRVDIFSIGMGKPIWGFQYGETYYQIGRLPFGGYCAFGEESNEEDTDPRSLMNSPLWARLLTVIGGSLFNILFAFLVMTIMFSVGYSENQISNQIAVPQKVLISSDQPEITSPAWEAGLRNGDRIIKIADREITHFSQIPATIAITSGFDKQITYVRNDQTNTLTLTAVQNKDTGLDIIGIYPVQNALVAMVQTNSPAEKAGLQAGDLIKKINGKDVAFFHDLNDEVALGKTMAIVIERSNKLLTINATPEKVENTFRLGVGAGVPLYTEVLKKAKNPIDALVLASQHVGSMVDQMISSITKLFSGEVNLEKNLSGPVRIVSITGDIAKTFDLTLITQFMVMLSIALAVFNMMPIPGLDGGAIILQTARSIFKGKPYAEKAIGWIEQAGVLLLLVLAVFVMFNDVKNISQSHSKAKKQQIND
ncbi:MAG: RIP metalloprotease RseP [Brevinema sp.]